MKLQSYSDHDASAYTSMERLIKLRHIANHARLSKRWPLISLQGSCTSRLRGRGLDFHEVRHYQAGDEIRHIDWRVTARKQKPHTKVFSADKEKPIFVACDQRHSLFFGSQFFLKSVVSSELAAIFSWSGYLNNEAVGGLVFSDEAMSVIRPKRTKNTLLSLLRTLNDHNNSLSAKKTIVKTIRLETILNTLKQTVRHGSTIFLISDFMDFNDQTETQLMQLKRNYDVISYLVFDPLEMQAPKSGSYLIRCDDEELLLDTSNKTICKNYEHQFQSRINHITKTHQRCSIPLIKVSTFDGAEQFILTMNHAKSAQ